MVAFCFLFFDFFFLKEPNLLFATEHYLIFTIHLLQTMCKTEPSLFWKSERIQGVEREIESTLCK